MNDHGATKNFDRQVSVLISESEDWLMARILDYAKRRGYDKYTSTLQEAWRLSISGLSVPFIDALNRPEADFELTPDEDFTIDPVASFGIMEAQRHRERGVNLGMFLGLMKYYRQSYDDVIDRSNLEPDAKSWGRHRMRRFFDRVEIGFCMAWSKEADTDPLRSLQDANRRMTNEKNKYLTLFESMPQPAFLVDEAGGVENLNQAAARMFEKERVPGAHYYRVGSEPEAARPAAHPKAHIGDLLPWLRDDFNRFMAETVETRQEEKQVASESGMHHFQIRLSKMLDISGKFAGAVVIVEDYTDRFLAEQERLRREKLEGILELAGAVCHELNQPVMAISGYSELALMSIDPDHALYGKLNKIGQQVQRMGDITKKLMLLTRHETKRYTKGERILDIDRSSGESTPGVPRTEDDPEPKEKE
ncbi:MAG: PAS domain-containing protein [Desulfobacterales bacterium]|nr:PAS domain-containing protein [Desulfobacterales bacterium]